MNRRTFLGGLLAGLSVIFGLGGLRQPVVQQRVALGEANNGFTFDARTGNRLYKIRSRLLCGPTKPLEE